MMLGVSLSVSEYSTLTNISKECCREAVLVLAMARNKDFVTSKAVCSRLSNLTCKL